MEPFVTHRGSASRLLDWTDVNTDLIIPARYLKKIERTGFGPLLFADKRYVAGGAPLAENPEQHGALVVEFPLNDRSSDGATVLVVGHNFGCGSSREHAVWAVMQAGFRAVIARGTKVGFADIFESNAFQNGLLAIELDEAQWDAIANAARRNPSATEVTIDLREQTVRLHAHVAASGEPMDARFEFEIPETHRHRLLHGLDSIAETLLHGDAISRHEQHLPGWVVCSAGRRNADRAKPLCVPHLTGRSAVVAAEPISAQIPGASRIR